MNHVSSLQERYDAYVPPLFFPAPEDSAQAAIYSDCTYCGYTPEITKRGNTHPFSNRFHQYFMSCDCKFGEPADSWEQAARNWEKTIPVCAMAYSGIRNLLRTTVAVTIFALALSTPAHAAGGYVSQGADIPFSVNMSAPVGDWTATALSVYGELDSTMTGAGNFRMLPQAAPAGVGSFFRNDGSNTYLLLTNAGDSLGTWNSLRPLIVNDATGAVILDATGAGKVGINNTSPQAELDVIGTAQVSGSMTALYYSHTSDRRLKSDIIQIPDALDKMVRLRGVSFKWKKTGQRDMGVIAQEVGAVFPDVVHTNKQGIKSVEYDSLVAPMIEAIRKLKEDNDQLRGEITAIKASIKGGNNE